MAERQLIGGTNLRLPTLEDHFSRFPSQLLNNLCKDEHLVRLSGFITDWRDLTPYLRLTQTEEWDIENPVPQRTPTRKRIDALRKWRIKTGPNATYRCLIKALHEAKRADLIDELRTIVTSHPQHIVPTANHTLTFEPELESAILSYGFHLKDRYKNRAVKISIQWPPPRTDKIFDLAMIKKDRVQRGKVDDDFVQIAITGRLSDVLLQKAVNLDKIFADIEDARRVVLIEGAPGSGKSTLTLNICQKWEAGFLFQEYSIVILVRLHDPVAQKAKNVEELLPYLDYNPDLRKKVATEIETSFGSQVLWVLDGWDELPAGLSHDSMIHKLVQRDSPLYKSSVIVTSRSTASTNLHQLVTCRYEIVGFTPAERREYFKECLKGDSELDSTAALETLCQQIADNPAVEASCYLPLNAAIIVHLYLVDAGSLPNTVHEIFTRVIKCILSRYLQEKIQQEDVPQEVVFDLLGEMPAELHEPFVALCKLAFRGVMETETSTFDSTDLKSVGAKEEVLKIGLLRAHSRIVSHRESTYYYFLHSSMQELLAAVHMSHFAPTKQISMFRDFFGQPRYSSLFQFYAGITKLTTKRPVVSRIPQALRTTPGDVLDIVKKIVHKENKKFQESKPLLVSLLHCLYEAQDATLCKFVAEQLGGKLDLNHTTLTPLNCLSIGYFVSSVCSTTTTVFNVNLGSCSINDQCCKFLMKGLGRCFDRNNDSEVSAYLEMDLIYNNISEEGADYIADVLCKFSILHGLSLGSHIPSGCNRIRSRGLNSILHALLMNLTLVELNLSGCSVEITAENGNTFTTMLENNKTLNVLKMSHNPSISDTGVSFVANGLKCNTALKVLDVSDCGIGPSGCNFLFTALKANNTLEELSLSHNEFRNEGMLHVASSKALNLNNTLKELNLSHCQIGDTGIEALSQALSGNKSLKKLDIRGNMLISENGMSYLTDTLSRNHQRELQTLLIPWNLNSSGAVRALKPKKKR